MAGGRLGQQCVLCLLDLAGAGGGGAPAAVIEPTRRSFGDYELLEEIARGGMGVVYRARQRGLDREVALKIVLGAELADQEMQRRFQREAHAAASLHHPNIVPVYEIGEDDWQPYFTMRLVPGGQSIADWAATRRRDQRALAAAVATAARAVSYAHERGVLHRDLKPSNVLWDPEHGPQVTDFGLAKWLDDPRSSLTQSQILGSPSYMAPEQARGQLDEVTVASDVYGLGALLYELLTGEPPFRAASSLETMQRAQTEPPERPSKRVPGVNRDLETICLKCLEKNPAQRYASARELAEELERFGRGEPIQARPVALPQQLWRWGRRNPSLAAALGILLAGVVATSWQWRQAEQARRGEQQANAQATANVADLLSKSGFTSARDGDPSRAALWFAEAAAASHDPVRRSVNSLRWRAWRDDAPTAVRAFAAGARSLSTLAWNEEQTALVVQHRNPEAAAVWDLASEARWRPDIPLRLALWLPPGRLLAGHDGVLRVLEFPSGREVLRLPTPLDPGAQQLAVSHDARWVGIGGVRPMLWDTASGAVHPLPFVGDRAVAGEIAPTERVPHQPGLVLIEFSRDGRHVLLSGRGWRATCALADPTRFAVAPMDSFQRNEFGFLAEGKRFVVQPEATRLLTVDAESGAVLASVALPPSDEAAPPRWADRPDPQGRTLARVGAPAVEIATGAVQDYPVHGNMFFGQEYSRDGRLLVTASVDDTVRLWRTGEGRPGQLVGWHQEEATSVAISPDQRFVATGQNGGGLVRIWRLPVPPASREVPAAGPTRVQVSDDRQWLVPAGWTDGDAQFGQTRVYSAGTLAPLPELATGGILTGAAFAPDAGWLALTVSSSPAAVRRQQLAAGEFGAGEVQFWDFRAGQRLRAAVLLPVEPRAVAVHPDGRRVGILGAGRSLYELDRESGTVRELQAPTRQTQAYGAIEAACRYSPDGALLIGWGRIFPPLIWESGTGRRWGAPHLEQARVWWATFHGATLATVTHDAWIDFTAVPEGVPRVERILDSNWLFFAQFDPAGDLFVTGGRGRTATVWDWRQRRLHAPAMLHDDEIFCATFVPGTPYLVTGGRDERLYFWDTRSGQQVRATLEVGGYVKQLAVLADGSLLVNRQQGGGQRPSGARMFDLAALLAPSQLPPEEAVALAEIDAAARIRRASLEPLTAADWLRRWRAFRAQRPEWHSWPAATGK